MTSTLASPPPDRAVPPARSRVAVRAVALTPLWVSVVLFVAQGTFWKQFFGSPPEMIGMPLGFWMVVLAAGWMLIGAALIWNAQSRVLETVVLLVFTIPATIFLILGPAVILILQNLS
jgi:hypothetical protein